MHGPIQDPCLDPEISAAITRDLYDDGASTAGSQALSQHLDASGRPAVPRYEQHRPESAGSSGVSVRIVGLSNDERDQNRDQ